MKFLLFYAYLWAFMPVNVCSLIRKRRSKKIEDSQCRHYGCSPVVKPVFSVLFLFYLSFLKSWDCCIIFATFRSACANMQAHASSFSSSRFSFDLNLDVRYAEGPRTNGNFCTLFRDYLHRLRGCSHTLRGCSHTLRGCSHTLRVNPHTMRVNPHTGMYLMKYVPRVSEIPTPL